MRTIFFALEVLCFSLWLGIYIVIYKSVSIATITLKKIRIIIQNDIFKMFASGNFFPHYFVIR